MERSAGDRVLRKYAFCTKQWPKKNTFEWPKVVPELSFARFWGVPCIQNWSQFFVVSVLESTVS